MYAKPIYVVDGARSPKSRALVYSARALEDGNDL